MLSPLLGIIFILAGEPARKDLPAHTITLREEKMPLQDVLQRLQKTTSNVIIDRRAQAVNADLKLDLKDATFWQALDVITEQAKCGYSLYQADGKIALVDAPKPRTQVFYHGVFRLAVKRLTVTRDQDSGTHLCTLTAEIAWEPRFQPIYLDVGAADVTFAADQAGKQARIKASGSGQINVTQRHAAEVEMRFRAPPRAVSSIASLNGTFTLLGPDKMLTFTFDKLEGKKKYSQTMGDVKVEINTPNNLKARPWTLGVVIHNPPGPIFESFQAGDWLAHNQMRLVKNGQTLAAEDFADLPGNTFARTSLEYTFTRNLPTDLNGWSLTYRTPGPIAEVSVPYVLKDIPLP